MKDEGKYTRDIMIDQAALWKAKKPILRHIDIELTERCNNNCVHCYINLPFDDAEVKTRELNTDQVKKVLKESADLGCMSVRFTGGEPLLRTDFEELYLYARKLGLQVIIFTNASLISAHLADLFGKVPPMRKISISIYGMSKVSYEKVARVSGSYDSAMKGMGLIIKRKIPFELKYALLPYNKHEAQKFENWAASVSGDSSFAPSYIMFYDLRCRRDSQGKNKMISDLRLSPQEGLKILARNRKEYVEQMKEYSSKFMAPQGNRLFACAPGVNSGCVDAYGNFQPCMLLRHPEAVYDLKSSSLRYALENHFPMVRQMKAINQQYMSTCARCFLKGLCEQCPGKSWMEHGNMDTPVKYLCDIAHTQARELGILKKDEKAWEIEDWEKRLKTFSQTA